MYTKLLNIFDGLQGIYFFDCNIKYLAAVSRIINAYEDEKPEHFKRKIMILFCKNAPHLFELQTVNRVLKLIEKDLTD